MTDRLFDPDECAEPLLLPWPGRRPIEIVETAPGYFHDEEDP